MSYEYKPKWRRRLEDLVAFAAVSVAVTTLLFVIVQVIIWTYPSDADITRILGDAGYSQVRVVGPRLIGCADSDVWRLGFEARSEATGRKVSGVFCSSPLKASVVRFD